MDKQTLQLNLFKTIATLTEEEYQLFLDKVEEIKNESAKAKKGIVEFTDKEINQMPKNLKRLLIIDKKRCRLRTRQSGKNTTTYEIRYRRGGYNITAAGKTIALAKANFISKCKAAAIIDGNSFDVPTTFNDFATFYFNTFRKEKVSAATLKSDMARYNKYLKPYFKNAPIKNINPSACKILLDRVKAQGLGKTADELHSLLNVIIKSAIAHGIIDRNPLDIVLHITHERESGKALTKDEEISLKSTLKGSQYLAPLMILLYTGLRPNELKTAEIQGNFIVAINSKRKNRNVVYKKIPIIKALKPYITDPLTIARPETLRLYLKQALPTHKLYDLRTTFYTRCDEFGVSAAARDEFVGHSNGVLTDTYRNLSDDYLLEQGKKLNKWQWD